MQDAWYEVSYVFFFQAEDGIRDKLVTGVQTCALPISLLHRSREELLHVGHHEPLVPTLGDLVLLVPRLDREEMALAVDLEKGGLRTHFHTDRRCGEVLHLDHGTDGSRPRRQVRLEDRSRGVFEHADDERRGEDGNAAITHGMGRPSGAGRVGDLRSRARLDVPGARV